MALKDIKVGVVMYRFHENYRVYPKDGPLHSRPIFREHFRPIRIVGETTHAWITEDEHGYPQKMGKRSQAAAGLFSEREVDEACWIEEHKFRIDRLVRSCNDYEVLARIGAILGVEPLP